MYRKLSDFVDDYKEESEKTFSTINSIPNSLLDRKVDLLGMSLGELSFHITQAIEKITSQIGFQFSSSALDIELPNDIHLISKLYEAAAGKVIEIVGLQTDDTFLDKTFPVYGATRSIGHTLSVLVKHEIHHRAQIVLGLRILGQGVPDIYGPGRRPSLRAV